MPIDEDPMRVRGSFYLASSGNGFGAKAGGANQNSKSPRAKKVNPTGRLGHPKKKMKLRLEPLGPRNMGVRSSNTGRNGPSGTDGMVDVQEQSTINATRVRGKEHFLMLHSLCLQGNGEKTSERGSMRTLDNQVRAQKIYMDHMQQLSGKEKTSKRQNSKMATIDNGRQQTKSRIEITEGIRTSRAQLNDSNMSQIKTKED